jgi:condensin complex subunit 1
MFSCLRDSDQAVRKSTLMVLTHLVLNDMLKVKSDISEIARCVTDENQAIIDAAKHFFVEIAKKSKTFKHINAYQL